MSQDDLGWDKIVKLMTESEGRIKGERIEITRESAARGQLESAILLWFLEGHVASIHTLAVAAQELLHGVGKKAGKPSKVASWIKSKPKAFQKLSRLPQNFFKHANTDPNASINYPPVLGDMHIVDAVMSYEDLFQKLPPVMQLFAARFAVEYPDILPVDYAATKILKGAKIDDLAELSRSDFLVECLARVGRRRKPT